eukprot:362220-Chlamydomonas_euryale.AAC.2
MLPWSCCMPTPCKCCMHACMAQTELSGGACPGYLMGQRAAQASSRDVKWVHMQLRLMLAACMHVDLPFKLCGGGGQVWEQARATSGECTRVRDTLVCAHLLLLLLL